MINLKPILMKTLNYSIIIISLLLIIVILSCQKPEEIIPPDENNNDSNEIPEYVQYLSKYSWQDCKYIMRQSDSSLYDMSSFYFADVCDSLIFTFDTNNVFYEHNICESNNSSYFWNFNSDYKFIRMFYDEQFSNLNYSYRIEELNDDTLKLFFIGSGLR